MNKKPFDLSLYLVTDRSLAKGRSLEWIVSEAVRGGVTLVQLREKDCTAREFTDLAIRLKQVLEPLNVKLIINDRLDIALASEADGLHLGQNDLPFPLARRLMGTGKIIGLSVETLGQVREANRLDVDYIGISPAFRTATKTDTPEPFGLEGISRATLLSRHPAVAIGGIDQTNAAEVIRAGADGIAVVSAIVSDHNPYLAARQLTKQIKCKS
ncbi:MAG: thiamine phosphate synthase [Mangrovibacterium sp.]